MFVDFVGVKHLYDLLAFQEIRNIFLGLLQAFVIVYFKSTIKNFGGAVCCSSCGLTLCNL